MHTCTSLSVCIHRPYVSKWVCVWLHGAVSTLEHTLSALTPGHLLKINDLQLYKVTFWSKQPARSKPHRFKSNLWFCETTTTVFRMLLHGAVVFFLLGSGLAEWTSIPTCFHYLAWGRAWYCTLAELCLSKMDWIRNSWWYLTAVTHCQMAYHLFYLSW